MGGKERWMRLLPTGAIVAEWQLLSLRSSSLREGAERAHRIAKAGYSLFLEKPPRETRRQGGLCSLARQSVARGLSPSSGRETDSLRTKPERVFPLGCGEHEAPGSDEGGTRAAPPSVRPTAAQLAQDERSQGDNGAAVSGSVALKNPADPPPDCRGRERAPRASAAMPRPVVVHEAWSPGACPLRRCSPRVLQASRAASDSGCAH